MSTKFNRNNTNVPDDKFYLNDYRVDLNGVERDQLEGIKDFEILPCIISGLTVIIPVYPATNATVTPGSTRDKDGKRIQIASTQSATLTDTAGGNNYIILAHKDSEDTPRKAYNTGVEYNTRKYDDFELTVASTYNADDIVLGNIKKEGAVWVLHSEERTPDVAKPFAIVPPPVPTRLDLSTGWDDIFRKNGQSAGLVSFRNSYIKAEFGDKGNGTASAETFEYLSNRVGVWTANEWVGQYLTCADGNSWRVISNTTVTLTLESGAVPVSGIFFLGPNAAGYKFLIQLIDQATEEVEAAQEAENQVAESPVRMEYIWHGLTPDIKYKIKVASKGSWFQKDWSDFCAAEEIIAGGPKEIPDACGDTIDGAIIISAADDGIRLSWSVKPAYEDKVSGFEICFTDDGVTTPDFDNLNHRKIFTDRNYVVLPARLSSDDTTVTVKAKIRAVDKAGRHCVTPLSLTDTDAKKYPADLSSVVTDYKNIISPGGFGTLKEFLQQSTVLETGKGKTVSEIESEIADARGTYATVGSRIAAILQGTLDYGFVRIVAKTGGQYTSIQAAVNSVATNSPHLILIYPDGGNSYVEDVIIPDNRVICFLGLGDVTINGRIYAESLEDNGGFCPYIGNIRIINSTDGVTPLSVRIDRYTRTSLFENLQILQFNATSGDAAQVAFNVHSADFIKLIVRNSYFKSSQGKGLVLGYSLESAAYQKIEIVNCGFDSAQACIDIEKCATNSELRLWESLLKTKATYSITNTAAQSFKLFMAHCRYSKLPDEANITEDYGTIEAGKVSNVKFDDADLEVLI